MSPTRIDNMLDLFQHLHKNGDIWSKTSDLKNLVIYCLLNSVVCKSDQFLFFCFPANLVTSLTPSLSHTHTPSFTKKYRKF